MNFVSICFKILSILSGMSTLDRQASHIGQDQSENTRTLSQMSRPTTVASNASMS